MSRLVNDLLALHGAIVYAIVGILVFAEDALLIGLVVPGDVAAILGGVAASRAHVSVVVVTIVVVIAAILGNAAGYFIGHHFIRFGGSRLLLRRRRRIRRAQAYLRRRGGPAVFIGRFVPFMRTTIPFLAGSSHMPYARFTAYTVSSATLWGIGSVALGFVAGNSYRAIANLVGPVTAGFAVFLLLLGYAAWYIRRRRRQRVAATSAPVGAVRPDTRSAAGRLLPDRDGEPAATAAPSRAGGRGATAPPHRDGGQGAGALRASVTERPGHPAEANASGSPRSTADLGRSRTHSTP